MTHPHLLVMAILAHLLLILELVSSHVISFDQKDGPLLGARDKSAPTIIVADNEIKSVVRTAQDLALDFGRVLGTNGTLVQSNTIGNNSQRAVVIVGTIGNSTVIDSLISKDKVDVSKVKGKWESYIQAVVDDPIPGVQHALVIAGSDKHGSIYGIYDISETMGVSPWYWWADVPVKEKEAIYFKSSSIKIQGPPSVRYRGFFINDESQLILWAKGKFPRSPQGGYFTSEFYKLVFELLLRLKANYLWPGMKRKEAFYLDDEDNGRIAHEYGIFMGTSHHEPMAKAYYEQQYRFDGAWDWSENKDNVAEFMRDGVNRTKNWDTLYTLGMRGDGDQESPTLTSSRLEEVIQAQQDMIEEFTGKYLKDVPQTWSLYKEVGRYWQEGMNVSDLVTLMWADDNFGNLLRVPLDNETVRSGGAGVYYHFGYVGDPRNYEWISTIQLAKTWEQMHLAYEKGAREIWIANSQDIKPYEISTNHFLDMAYDMSKFQTAESTTEWLKAWAKREFDSGIENATAEILNIYGRLVLRRKYETLSMNPFAYSTLNYDEATNVLQEWEDLLEQAQKVYYRLGPSARDTFYELVLHQVLAGKYVQEVYVATELGKLYKNQLRTSTNRLAAQARAAFVNDAATTNRYHELFDGKWNHIMSSSHIDVQGRNPPPENRLPILAYITDDDVEGVDVMGVSAQGLNTSSHEDNTFTLRSVDPYMPSTEKRYIDVFARANGTFVKTIKSNVSYVSISSPSRTLTSPGNNSDSRSYISVDWSEAPKGLSWASLTITSTTNNNNNTQTTTTTALLPINRTTIPSDFTGFIESNGVISIEPTHWTSITPSTQNKSHDNSPSYIKIPYYGRTSSGIKLWPVTTPSQTAPTGPKLSYNIYTFTSAPSAKLTILLGGSLNHDPTRPLKLAYSLDDDEPETVQVLADYQAGSMPRDWDTAVITGGWNTTATVDVEVGKHVLNLWLLEPGVVVQKILLDLGGLLPSYLGPPESRIIG